MRPAPRHISPSPAALPSLTLQLPQLALGVLQQPGGLLPQLLRPVARLPRALRPVLHQLLRRPVPVPQWPLKHLLGLAGTVPGNAGCLLGTRGCQAVVGTLHLQGVRLSLQETDPLHGGGQLLLRTPCLCLHLGMSSNRDGFWGARD